MTGINQTLLLAISMLGIAAIMGAGGLGRLLFKAINNQSVADGAAAGLAFFLVAVVLDRISQRDGETRSMFHRIRLAWMHRRNPEPLLSDEESARKPEEPDQGTFAVVSASERLAMGITGIGGILAVVSAFLTWSSDAGFISAYGRKGDLDLAGESFNGLSASGGSWFGYIALAFGSSSHRSPPSASSRVTVRAGGQQTAR